MRKPAISLIITLFLVSLAFGQYNAIPSYYTPTDFLMGTSSAFQDGLLGFTNPANLSFLKAGEGRFYWSTDGTVPGSFNNWGLFMAAPHAGFGMIRQNFGTITTTDYRISLGMGNDRASVGIGYGWGKATVDAARSEKTFISSLILRPARYLSLGLIGDFSFESKASQGVAELGIRPLGTSQLTLFGDFAMQNKTKFNDAPWSTGAAFELARGISITGRYFESKVFTLGLTLDFGKSWLSQQNHFDDDGKYAFNTYSVRMGGARPSKFPELVDRGRRFVKINLRGGITYMDYIFSRSDKYRFYDLVNNIKAATDDPRVSAIALNVSDANIVPELAWEIRQALKRFREKGKIVVAFIDYANIRMYYLASVADILVMDPGGYIQIEGVALGHTYFKGTLDKLGLGFDEWRFFKYKSAAEVLSRTDMSEADREQNQAFIDDLYDVGRDDICQSRGMSLEELDVLVNDQALFSSGMAIEADLVDTVGRWPDVDKVMDKIMRRNVRSIAAVELLDNALPPKYWGGDPQIALVYGIGDCAMDTGIRARWLQKRFKALARDRSIKAVVFRVDSPGGDGLASDYVAEALKECARKKPVIVSQGQVAGSGGYWISMYGDKILAGPTTITGSIGVIGGWIWDKGMSDKLGITSDYVTRGKHADLGRGVRLPILNITVPARDLTGEERGKVKNLIMTFYDEFVEKVAQSRDMSVERVNEIAQGRFYSGLDGLEVGLVDDIGGLMMAIELAKEEAGIPKEQRAEIIEIPENLGWFPLRAPSSMIDFGQQIDPEDPAIKYIKMLNDSPYKALPMLPPGTYPEAEE